MLKVIELFSGIGAQRKALERAGIEHEIVGVSEIDKYACKVYETLYGKTPNFGDITSIEKLPKADMWTYSFPCTDISLCGRLGGLEKGSGTHSSLLWEVQRLLEVSNTHNELPRYLLLENVKNLVSKTFKPYFDEWLTYLEKLGYKNFYKILNSKDYGVPQNRERVFMLSIRDDDASYEFPDAIPLEKKLKDMLEDDVDEKYYLSEKLITCFTSMKDRNGMVRGLRFRPKGKDADYSWTITTCPGSRATDTFIIEPVPAALRGRRGDDGEYHQHLEIRNDGNTNTLTTVQKDNIVIVPQNTKKGYAIAHVGDGIYTNRTVSKRGVVQKDSIPTLKTSPNDVAVVVDDPKELISIRRMTPRECWRLMGWEDKDIDLAFSSGVSETQLYKMAGNSIVVNCLEKLFSKIDLIKEDRLIVVATENEYNAFKGKYNGEFLISGIGYGNVYKSLADVDRNTKILNVGFAGSNSIPVGKRCKVGISRNYHPGVEFEEESYELSGDTDCYTSSDFVVKANIDKPCVFDMELYAILSMGFTDVEAIKIVSDNLSLEQYEKEINNYV